MKTNRAAFGAKIKVTVKGTGGFRQIYRTVGYGSSFGGNPLRQHIGIGNAQRVEEIEVTWPTSKTVQSFRNVAVDKAYHLREGASIQSVPYHRIQLRHLPSTPHHMDATSN